MNEFESIDPITPDQTCLEDVTKLIFNAVEHLNDCEFLAKQDFDLNETMSAFESMDSKMDTRLKRNEVPHPRELIRKGILIVDRPLTEDELIYLLDEFFT